MKCSGVVGCHNGLCCSRPVYAELAVANRESDDQVLLPMPCDDSSVVEAK